MKLALQLTLAALAATPAATQPSPPAPAQAVTAVADEYLAVLDSLSDATRRRGWSDRSAAARAAFARREDGWLARIRDVDAHALAGTPAARTYAVLREQLEASTGMRVCRTELWSVDQLGGWHLGVANAAATSGTGTPDARARAIARFDALGAFVDGEIANLREGLRLGYTAPRSNVRRVVEQLDALLPDDVRTSPLYAPARRDTLDGFPAAWEASLRRATYPALRRYRDFLRTDYLARAREPIGVGALPDGNACYRAVVRSQTSLDIAPEEMVRVAIAERAKVEARLAPLLAELAPGLSPVEARARVRYDPAFRFATREEIVDSARANVARARAAMPRILLRVPTDSLDVQATPAFRERSDAPARYQRRDGSTVATMLINTFEPTTRPRAESANAAFHEGMPGHHLQIVYPQSADAAHPIVQRFGTGAFTEGWAFYAEQLADELGLYASPRERAAYLLHQIDGWLGVQVDASVHVLGWTREMAIDTIMAGTGKPRAIAESYADRHAATPAQLATYMLGYREFVRLRAEAQRALGPRFDLRQFHDVVLRDGSVPLSVLRGNVESWVRQSP